MRGPSIVMRAEIATVQAVPDGLTPGTPFTTLVAGECVSPFTGKRADIDRPIDRADLDEIVRVFYAQAEISPVVIDWGHESVGSPFAASTPESGGALGRITDVEVVEDERGASLLVTPAYTAKGLRVVEEHQGALWSSPEFIIGPVFHRTEVDTEIGKAQLLAVALTSRPMQAPGTIDPVQRSQRMADESTVAEREAPATLEEALELIASLKEEIADLKASEEMPEERAQDDPEKDEPKPTTPEGESKGGADDEDKEAQDAKRAFESSPYARAQEARLRVLEARAELAEEKHEVDGRIQRGLITPAERERAVICFKLRAQQPLLWSMYSERTVAEIPLGEIGHGGHDPNAALGESEKIDKIVNARLAKRGLGQEHYTAVFQELMKEQP
jgi:hypothetical protein